MPTRWPRVWLKRTADELREDRVPHPRHQAAPLMKIVLGFRVWGLGFRVWGLGFRVQGLGFRVWGGLL